METAAQGLAAALAGNTSQPDPDYQVTGTGFGLNDDDTPEPTKAPATDPSQGRGNRRPRRTEDPIMNAFQLMGLA